MEKEKIQTPSTKKKISFFSAMLIVMGGSIGAGIFFKSGTVLGNSQSSLILAIFCWLIASCAVIAMALALIEVSSVKNDNLSLIGWCKVFNGRTIYKASKNFMVYVYLPLTYLFMPLYVLLSLQDGLAGILNKSATFGTGADWIIWTIISLVITIYFLTVPTLWSKLGDIHNKVVLAVKFIPLVFVTVIGFVLIFAGKSGVGDVHIHFQAAGKFSEGSGVLGINGIGAGLGMFLSMSAIFFAYDGFYVASGIQSEMKEPKKTPMALFFGLGITTIVYLLISISLSLNGGNVFSMGDFFGKMIGETPSRIIFGVMNLMIAIGVLGIINGFSMWAPRYVEDLLAQGELPFWEKVKGKLNPNFPKIGVIYALSITIPVVIVFTIIGALAYVPNGVYTGYDSEGSNSMQRLYGFADLMSNWTALFTFAFIGAAIYGGIKNRKSNKIHINDKKQYFLIAAWVAVILVFAALTFTVVVPIIDLFAIGAMDKTKMAAALMESEKITLQEATALADKNYNIQVISRVTLVIVLGLNLFLTFIPTLIEDYLAKKKYGSLEKFEQYKQKTL
ncbi:APC family permease [Mycoplasmopsis alligatoris]|uniref:Amino acid permease n=1 Tax=Mycoplasmopsis alligatoris A21JP2 TaxID=747682 RepID=D4XVP1_9BACT|nr:APC family permease [Mycoplasmopsis alligatoris]EFF41586.1 amino acid permease [Mycoplasmopsis alligatoris A21JP2]